jgi:hypothetical protein
MTGKARGLVWCLAFLVTAACGGTSRKELEQRGPQGTGDNAAGATNAANPCPFATLDLSSGVETCDDAETNPGVSFTHRAREGEGCSYDLELADTCNLSGCPGPYPFCDEQDGEAVCGSGCRVDSDCDEHEICSCQGPGLGGRCKASECKTDAACPAGQLCASLDNSCGLPSPYVCQNEFDQCIVSSECPTPGDHCVPIPSTITATGTIWTRICVGPATCPNP